MSNQRIVLLVAFVSACGSSPPAAPTPPAGTAAAPAAAAAPTGPSKRYDAATLFKNVRVNAAGFSHDGSKVLVAMDLSGVLNLYTIPTDGGEPQRLTTSAESQTPVGYFRNDDRVLYLQDT